MNSSRIFALIIGIDNYKSGSIWNLHSCVEDAKKMKRWLVDKLNVPRNQIRVMLDHDATKSNIEDAFMDHLVNNPSIEIGDAILIYFAGHGSHLQAPPDWYELGAQKPVVEVLCPYDHDTKVAQGRIAGISDRSLHAMIEDLAASKGDNITLFLDCCFAPVQTPANISDRSVTRWTKTSKAIPSDLYCGLWLAARGKSRPSTQGFGQSTGSHVLLAACIPGQKAVESKEGGRFTAKFLHAASVLPLHLTTYEQLVDHLRQQPHDDSQQYTCLGKHASRILFDDVPFLPDNRFAAANMDERAQRMKIAVGAIHGISEGAEFSIHLHNYHHSPNSPLGTVIITDVLPSFCLARVTSQLSAFPNTCWAQVTKWNNSRPFCVYLKSTLASLFRLWNFRKSICSRAGAPSGNEADVLRVDSFDAADMTLTVGAKGVLVHQTSILQKTSSNHSAKFNTKDPNKIIDDAARFYLHLFRNNNLKPLLNLIDMEIWRLDPLSWSQISDNYLQNGTAIIPYEKGAIYQITLHNNSNIDLWPYIAYMDPNHYTISSVYSSDSCKEAPLRSKCSLNISSGKPGSEAIRFLLDDNFIVSRGFLKVFLSSVPVTMRFLEQGSPSYFLGCSHHQPVGPAISPSIDTQTPMLWDTALASLAFVQHPDGNS